MDLNKQKEQFSIAYLHALTSSIGVKMSSPLPDDDSVDWTITGYRETSLQYAPRLDVQLKCTAYEAYKSGETIPFDLEQKNYNDLCETPRLVPFILIVVIVPRLPETWLHHTEDELSLRHCAYWHSLKGERPIHGTQKRIHLERTHVLDQNALRMIMQQIGRTGDLS